MTRARALKIVSPLLEDEGLSPQRRRVAELMLIGLSAEDIAAALHLNVHTVRNHRFAVYRHFDVQSQTRFMASILLPKLYERAA